MTTDYNFVVLWNEKVINHVQGIIQHHFGSPIQAFVTTNFQPIIMHMRNSLANDIGQVITQTGSSFTGQDGLFLTMMDGN